MTSYRKLKEENELLKEKNEKLKLEVDFLEYIIDDKNETLSKLKCEKIEGEKKNIEKKFLQCIVKIIFVIQMAGLFLSFFF